MRCVRALFARPLVQPVVGRTMHVMASASKFPEHNLVILPLPAVPQAPANPLPAPPAVPPAPVTMPVPAAVTDFAALSWTDLALLMGEMEPLTLSRTYRPHLKRRKRTYGFMKRLKSSTGRRIIARRRAKGRKAYAV